ncbi:hypothetical protein PHMEG_00013819 [Phytophthora megakarya]|uniref:Uncharacterized protein n=1 Tax=Phytophthora megakarya TaxID=4795 RepID=A0A225W6V7_9STRA|nr:hypothetical protein PHMEG_00013819 [Phytophthora megakarya]
MNQAVTSEIKRPSEIAEYRRSQPWIYYRDSLVVTGNIIRHENGFAKPRAHARSTMRKRSYSKIPAPTCPWWTPPLLLSRDLLDLAHGSISLSDEAKVLNVGQYLWIQTGESVELSLRSSSSIRDKLWVTRGDQWVPIISDGPGRTKYISVTNIGDEVLILDQDQQIGIWLAGDHVPRLPGFISVGSRRYMEWQHLALEASTDAGSEDMEFIGKPRRNIQTPIPVIGRGEDLYAVNFDRSACVKRGGGAYRAVWKLPQWRVLKARFGYAEGLTVNEAEYHGLPLCLDLLEDFNPRRLLICGASDLVVRQVRGKSECKAPGLTLRHRRDLDRL